MPGGLIDLHLVGPALCHDPVHKAHEVPGRAVTLVCARAEPFVERGNGRGGMMDDLQELVDDGHGDPKSYLYWPRTHIKSNGA
jgi:hypothetical protein